MDQATDLRALVRQVGSSRAPIAARPRRIVVFGGKEGVGATTIAVNLSVVLAQQGERCLLCDAAGGDVSMQLGLEPRYSLNEVFNGHRGTGEILINGPAGIHVVPSSPDLAQSHDAPEHAWNRFIAQLPSLACRPQAIVIDAGSRPDALSRHLWQTADRVLLVTVVEPQAVMNAYAAIKLLNDSARSASIAVLVNRSPGEAAADEAQRRLTHATRRFLGLPLRNVGTVPEDNSVPQCAARGEAFLLAAPACRASLALRQAVRALTNQATERRPVAA